MAIASLPTFLSSVTVDPLTLAKGLLQLSGVQVSIHGRERLPGPRPLILVSNHRSVLDALLLMQILDRPVRFACHHYMGQVPGLREVIATLGCLPLDAPNQGQTRFFRQALQVLKRGEAVGIFPEGATPMVQGTVPHQLSQFHRGFAHLALRAPVEEVWIVPIAIASGRETQNALMPLRLFSLFDTTEPLFQQPGWHSAVFYQEVSLRVGHPIRVDGRLRSHYRARGAATLVADLTNCCQEEIANLLSRGPISAP
ncbi:MAG TPA: 1-acyl-sn-glycerol-3-phosphate acyltransferase [Leptolyngbyaceae cyanobacterium M65_K2018_010]|nr:1-acyl-sn-glycerol-3-phosphate acyltransferase [Leptolyngbyaceae cyanobacterium M65_K2018_010]